MIGGGPCGLNDRIQPNREKNDNNMTILYVLHDKRTIIKHCLVTNRIYAHMYNHLGSLSKWMIAVSVLNTAALIS